jgi:hypothetical protein
MVRGQRGLAISLALNGASAAGILMPPAMLGLSPDGSLVFAPAPTTATRLP